MYLFCVNQPPAETVTEDGYQILFQLTYLLWWC